SSRARRSSRRATRSSRGCSPTAAFVSRRPKVVNAGIVGCRKRPSGLQSRRFMQNRFQSNVVRHALLFAMILFIGQGCAQIRVTDPPRTATELFLLSGAASEAVAQLAADPLRDRLVWIDTQYLSDTRETSTEISFLI